MKLATYKDGSRDGQLVVVSRDLVSAHYASGIANRLQPVLEDWNFISPPLQDLYQSLNHGKARHAFAFDPSRCMAPLPRAWQWAAAADAGAALERLACDHFAGPADAVRLPHERAGADFGPRLVAATGDVRAGRSADAALDGIRLLLLACDWSVHGVGEDGAGSAEPVSTAFAPVAITPDEAGPAWQQGRLELDLRIVLNDRKFGRLPVATAMGAPLHETLAALCRLRDVRAASLIGSQVLASAAEPQGDRADATVGFGSLAQKRAFELARDGQPKTPFMAPGDCVRIEITSADGDSLFGAIEQQVAPATEKKATQAEFDAESA